MSHFLLALDVPLPGKEVKPGETWKARRPGPFDGAWKLVEPLQGAAWGVAENQFLEMTYTYSGLRTVNGAERAVIQLRGQATTGPGPEAGSSAGVSGTAVVDLATGQVVEEEVTTQAHAELVFFNTATVKSDGLMVARLRRE